MDLSIAKEFLIFKDFVLGKIKSLERKHDKLSVQILELNNNILGINNSIKELRARDEDTIIQAWFDNFPRDKDGRIIDNDNS